MVQFRKLNCTCKSLIQKKKTKEIPGFPHLTAAGLNCKQLYFSFSEVQGDLEYPRPFESLQRFHKHSYFYYVRLYLLNK